MPLFTDQITQLESPIDVMYLMHKVYMKHSDFTENLALEAQEGGDLTVFKANLDAWLKHLLYHAQTEDEYMTEPLKDKILQDGREPLKANEVEHDELRQFGGSVLELLDQASAENVLASEEEEHAKLMEKVDQVEEAAGDAIAERFVKPRTRRHLYRSVMELRVSEFDHFENEEAFVLPIVKEQMSSSEELECSRRLLIDDDSDQPRWIIDFIIDQLEGVEKQLVMDLDKQFQ